MEPTQQFHSQNERFLRGLLTVSGVKLRLDPEDQSLATSRMQRDTTAGP